MESPAPPTEPAETRRFRRLKPIINNSNDNACLLDHPPLIQTTNTRCKSSISSLFLSTFTNNNSPTTTPTKKNNTFTIATASALRGLGCSSSSEVHIPKSAPALVRSSADWQSKKVRKKPPKTHPRRKQTTPIVVPDVWCSPGISISTDVAPIDCAVSRRPTLSNPSNPPGFHGGSRVRRSVSSFITADAERIYRERSCIARRSTNPEQIFTPDSPSIFETRFSGSDLLQDGNYCHLRSLQRSPGGLAEIMMLQTSLFLGGMDVYDRYRDWRLDVDNMSYEELLDLGDRIGYVSTGLREEEIVRCLRKMEHSIFDVLPSHFSSEKERKCSICQEEYEENDEVGRLECGHSYHVCCIKQWLLQKNACPVCKASAAATTQN